MTPHDELLVKLRSEADFPYWEGGNQLERRKLVNPDGPAAADACAWAANTSMMDAVIQSARNALSGGPHE